MSMNIKYKTKNYTLNMAFIKRQYSTLIDKLMGRDVVQQSHSDKSPTVSKHV